MKSSVTRHRRHQKNKKSIWQQQHAGIMAAASGIDIAHQRASNAYAMTCGSGGR